MSNGNLEEVLLLNSPSDGVEKAEELLESQGEPAGLELSNSTGSEKVVQSIQIDLLERRSFLREGQYDGENSGQSSAAQTPLEQSEEVGTGEGCVEMEIREWSSLINLLSRIPVKAQKGLSTFDLKLTCISTIGEEVLVLGTNVGVVYWYDRCSDKLDRLKCEGVNPVTCLGCIGTVDYMVAAGNQQGLVTIFQIPRESNLDHSITQDKQYERKNKTSQKFQIQELHKGAVTSLEWSRNGMKLFSGDQTGHVVLTDIDYDLVQIRSSILICENYEIVQLSYIRKSLLICSTFRSIIYSLEEKNFSQVGSLERKVTGKFGGLIVSSAWEESPKVYSVRPGARLWVANLSGVVQHTIKFKELILSGTQPEIHVIKTPKPRSIPPDVQFTRLHRFMKDYLVTHYKDVLHIIDSRNSSVLGVCKELRSIIDVSVSRDEIFVLESHRNVIRLSAKADKFSTLTSPSSVSSVINGMSPSSHGGISSSSNSSAFLQSDNYFTTSTTSSTGGGIKGIPDIMSASISDFRFPQEPISYLTSKIKETSEKVNMKINPLLNTIKTVIEADVDIEDGQKLLEEGLPPPVMTMEQGDIAGFDMFTSPPPIISEKPVFVPEPERFQKISNLPYEDVVVETKPLKKTKKNQKTKARKEGVTSETASDTVSLSSAYSNTSGSDTNNIPVPGAPNNNAPNSTHTRKLSFKSDYTLSSSNSGSEGAGAMMSVSEHPQIKKSEGIGGPISLSQSWSVSSLVPTKKVTTEELNLKEELLAIRLKWPELLPASSRNSQELFEEDSYGKQMKTSMEGSSMDEEDVEGEDTNYWQVNLTRRKGPRNTKREDRASVSTLVAPSADENTESDSKTISIENGSSFGTVIERKDGEGEEASSGDKKDPSHQECSASASDEEDKYYMDIYNRYRNKDSISSYNSVLSFGPPSGSSHVSSGPGAMGAAVGIVSKSQNGSLQENGNCEESLPSPAEPSPAEEDHLEEKSPDSSKTPTASSSSSPETVEALDSIVESKVVTDEHWRKWRLPECITQVCLCDHYILCVGSKGRVYYAPLNSLNLLWKSTGYIASSMAISPCGSIVWRIYKGDLFSLTNLASPNAPTSNGIDQWTKLTYKKVVLNATVQKSFGWIVKVDGSLEFCTGLLKTTMVPYFESVYTPWPLQQVSCFDHKLWGLTDDGRIVLRTCMTQHNPKGVDWLELRWSSGEVPPACNISSCGGVHTDDGISCVWFSDSNGDLYFTSDQRDSRGFWIPWKVSASSYIQSTSISSDKSTEHRNALFNSIKEVSKSIKSLVQQSGSKPGLFLASSSSSVWFAAPDTNIIYGNRNSIAGHYWKPLRVDRGLTVPSSWKNIYANSIYQGYGLLWVSDNKGNLFYLPPSGGKVQRIDPPMFTDGQVIGVAPAPEALWLLSSTGDIHGRCDITRTDSVGKEWRQISLSTLRSSQFIHISCGSDTAWAVDDRGEAYMRMGSLKPPGAQDMSPAWNKVESAVCCKGIFSKVYVGTNGSMVWALDKKNQVFMRQAVFPDYPIGTGWLLVKGIKATMLALSDSAVWALTPDGQIFRRHGISQTNFVGDYWRKVPGAARSIAVSLCDELWALSLPEGYLLKHSKQIMTLTGWPTSTVVGTEDEEDDDWEIVETAEV